jgi:hypothetical protein
MPVIKEIDLSVSSDASKGFIIRDTAELMVLVRNDLGEHRVLKLHRSSGLRTVIGGFSTSREAFEVMQSLREEEHNGHLNGLPDPYDSGFPTNAFYAYFPTGISISSLPEEDNSRE